MSRIIRRAGLVTAAVLALAVGAVPAAAQHHDPAPVADIADADFLGQAAQANRFEIVTGRLAADRGRSRAVRRLGRTFVRDHTAALEQGTALATALGITPPPGLNPMQQAAADKLADLRGRRFDRAWLRAQRVAHVEAVALHLRGALTGDTAEVRTLAINALPIVAAHLGELKATKAR